MGFACTLVSWKLQAGEIILFDLNLFVFFFILICK